MSDYSHKLLAIAEKEKKLLKEKAKLLEQRKSEIGNLAERCFMLSASDELIAGIFLQLKQALDEKSEKLKEWEAQGERFLKPRKQKQGT